MTLCTVAKPSKDRGACGRWTPTGDLGESVRERERREPVPGLGLSEARMTNARGGRRNGCGEGDGRLGTGAAAWGEGVDVGTR